MKRIFLWIAVLGLAANVARAADAPAPAITGIAHIGYYVTDMAKARAYYEGFLGFQEAFAVKDANGADHVVYVKINDHEYIVLIAEPATNHGFIHDVAFQSSDVKETRARVIAAGYAATGIAPDYAGDLAFSVTDAAGFTVEVVQYQPKSLTGTTKGKFMPATRISDHIDHVGLLTNDKEAAWEFYAKAFGFVKDGDGSKMTIVAGSNDRFEVGFEHKAGTIDRFHVKDHICLSAPDVRKVTAALSAKGQAKDFKEIENHQLGSGKNVAELYDLDGNRVEMMEPPKS